MKNSAKYLQLFYILLLSYSSLALWFNMLLLSSFLKKQFPSFLFLRRVTLVSQQFEPAALKQPALGTASFSLHYKRMCGFELRKGMGRRETEIERRKEGGFICVLKGVLHKLCHRAPPHCQQTIKDSTAIRSYDCLLLSFLAVGVYAYSPGVQNGEWNA